MQTTLRHIPVPSAEIGRIVPGRPVGEEWREHRQPARGAPEAPRPEATAIAPDRSGRSPRLWQDPPRLPGQTAFRPEEAFGLRRFPGDGFSRESLLQLASFQAQHLGQVPPYENEALLRVTASDAYRRAGSLSVEYLGSLEPLDITV